MSAAGGTGPGADIPTGWHALPMTPQHTLRDGLYAAGRLVATVEAFGDRGPWYPNAEAPDGTEHRGGPKRSHTDAAEWAERVALGGHRAGAWRKGKDEGDAD